MLDACLRAAEVLHIHIHDVDWKRGKILVKQGKGKKDRVLWLNESAMAAVTKMENHTKETDGATVFDLIKGRLINSSYLRVMVKRYARQAKIFKDVHPHTPAAQRLPPIYIAPPKISALLKKLWGMQIYPRP